MRVAYSEPSLRQFAKEAMVVSEDRPLFMDRFLRDAIEGDVDILCDGDDTPRLSQEFLRDLGVWQWLKIIGTTLAVCVLIGPLARQHTAERRVST